MIVNFKAIISLLIISNYAGSAPTKDKTQVQNSRQPKSLPFFEYYQPEDIDYGYDPEADEYIAVDVEENELSRTIPSRKQYNTRPQTLNSPIYYIRLPPQPYMFVPGLGYVSEPSSHPMNQFLNVPVNFIANGKPSTIYQWNGGLGQFPGALPPPPPLKPKPQPTKPNDSRIHNLPGQYVFNGKPDDIYVLRDSYNSLYSDALQNFYP